MHNDRGEAFHDSAGPRRTQKRRLLGLVIAMSPLLLFLASCASSTSLTSSDNGKTIQVHVGDTIDIALDSSPGTGYGWAIEKSDETLLTLKQSKFSASSGAIGSSGTETFTLLAKRAGTVNLQLKYWRSFEGDRSITRRFAVTMQIQT
ncbi:MAG TPA: protease inhibitor I42 family protein [Ktedonobacteraceae bacterium]|jgi:predicted secreted protein|nr:protease inhibitor I42 family protein [Ktedonobacteraceae bacterium]